MAESSLSPVLDRLVEELQSTSPEAITARTVFRGDLTLTIRKEDLLSVVAFLRDNAICPFPLCEDVFGIDTFERKNRFEVNYHFWSIREKVRIHLKVGAGGGDPVVPSITGLFPGANWYERETWDMYGISFSDHPDLRRMYMPEDYPYHPLRKDVPLMGIPDAIPLPKR